MQIHNINIYFLGRRLAHAVTGSYVSMTVFCSSAVAAEGYAHAFYTLLCFWKSGGMLPLTDGQLLCTLQYWQHPSFNPCIVYIDFDGANRQKTSVSETDLSFFVCWLVGLLVYFFLFVFNVFCTVGYLTLSI